MGLDITFVGQGDSGEGYIGKVWGMNRRCHLNVFVLIIKRELIQI
jgi:hypothetical protein